MNNDYVLLVSDWKNNDIKLVPLSEEDIYRKYVQGYGISWKKFEKNYLPILRKMRGKNHKLKEFSENMFKPGWMLITKKKDKPNRYVKI